MRLGIMESAVVRSAREAKLPATDEAGIRAARRLARVLDEDEDDPKVIGDISSKLIDALTKLGLTNAGRVVRGKATEEKSPGEVKNSDRKNPATVLKLLRDQARPGA